MSSSIAAAAVVIGAVVVDWMACCGGGGGVGDDGGGGDPGLCTDTIVCDVCGGLDDGAASETSSAIGISSSTFSVDVVVVVVVAEMIGAFCAVVVDGFVSTEVECSSKDVDATE